MPENKGKRISCFQAATPTAVPDSKSTVDWVVPLCPGTHTPPALWKFQREMAFLPDWKIQDSKHSKGIFVQEPNT